MIGLGIFCAVITLGLIVGGILLVIGGGEMQIGGIMMLAVAPVIVVMFGIMLYFQLNQEKLRQRAIEKIKEHAEKEKAARLAQFTEQSKDINESSKDSSEEEIKKMEEPG